jgi:hypothetical protein
MALKPGIQTTQIMKNLFRLLIVSVLFSFALTGCYYDKEDALYPSPPCDTSAVTYSQTIAPIMTAHCNVCHNASLSGHGVITDNYDDLSIPAKNGQLWASVSRTGSYPMPKDNDQLSACELEKIKIWVDAKAPRN